MSKGDVDERLEAALAQERRRLARDVHDALGGDLVAVKMALAVLGRRLPHDAALREQWTYVDKLVDGAIDSMHHVVETSQMTLASSLDQILAQHLDDFSRQSGLACHQEFWGTQVELNAPSTQALYYILRECLSNIGKHAKAEKVRVALRIEEDSLILEVEDDGVGLGDTSSTRNGFGLRSMQERAKYVGGEFSIRGIAPHGTLVMIEIPLGNARA
jgi:signal transduction histidine kinase